MKTCILPTHKNLQQQQIMSRQKWHSFTRVLQTTGRKKQTDEGKG